MPAMLKDQELQPSARAAHAVSMASANNGGGGGGGGGFFERCCSSGVSCSSFESVRPASPLPPPLERLLSHLFRI